MSKKHRKRHNAISGALTPIANPRLLVPPKPSAFSAVEDRRKFHPEKALRPARTLSGHPVKPHRVKLAVTAVKRGPDGRPMKFKRPILHTVPSRLQFAVPKRTIICLKRKIREEVLHAFNKTGKGKGRRRPRRNVYSSISC